MTNNTDYYSSSYILLINNSQATMQATDQQQDIKDSDSSDGYTNVATSPSAVIKYFDLPSGFSEESETYNPEPLQQALNMLY
tara:strand:+ start:198 stop:443 length:246 start_codon:yes stop_codon:yes gene_type:complete